MEFVEPLRSQVEIDAMKFYFKSRCSRDYLLFVMGINVAFRITDLLGLKVGDVKGAKSIRIRERKTGKTRSMIILPRLRKLLDEYCDDLDDDLYLFRSSTKLVNRPISRVQAYRIIKRAAAVCGIKNIGTHSLRKTFGYHFYLETKDVVKLMKLFGHSAPDITLRYIGIERDEIEESIKKWGGF